MADHTLDALTYAYGSAKQAMSRSARASGATSVRDDAIAAQLPRDVRARLRVNVMYDWQDDVMRARFIESGTPANRDRALRLWTCALEQRQPTGGRFGAFYKIPDAFLALLCLEV